jgi:hypothetical protein
LENLSVSAHPVSNTTVNNKINPMIILVNLPITLLLQ